MAVTLISRRGGVPAESAGGVSAPVRDAAWQETAGGDSIPPFGYPPTGMNSAAKYLRPDIIAQVQRLDLKARFIVEGFISGLHNSPFQGFSVEFSEHRKYVPGDDLRQIDWSVYGRTDRFYIKKYDAETNLECHLIIDTSASMAYPPADRAVESGRMTKLDYAICLAAALGYLMINQQDAVGMARFDDRLRGYLPPKSKRTHLMRLIGELARVKPAPDKEHKGLAEALHEVARRVHRRGLMVILSDLLVDAGEVIEALHHLRFRGHDVILFQVLDQSEVEFPFGQLSEFVDPESGQRLTVHPQAVRERYLAALRDFTERYRRETAGMRADFVQVDTSMTFDRALVQFLFDRRRRF